MKFVMFYHSLVSDWNHGNAHFLRGVVSELIARGHDVQVYEPADAWSLRELIANNGHEAAAAFERHYPELRSRSYQPESLDLAMTLEGADVVIVHEWNDPGLVRRLGEQAVHGDFRLLFHDTHHRSVTDPQAMSALDLRHYDGVLAFGRAIAERYLLRGWARRAWVWHEAADTRRFHPREDIEAQADLVWIGNWGDDERAAELHEFLIEPVASLRLSATVHGVRYPRHALDALDRAGIHYGGWIPNYDVPPTFARHRMTVHVPRRAYSHTLTGIPTIRMFEALACGIPLVSAPWEDDEHLFSPGRDYLVARTGAEMRGQLHALAQDESLRRYVASHGLATIRARHTCAHRVDELLAIVGELDSRYPAPRESSTRQEGPHA